MNYVEIVNTILENSSQLYRDTVPVMTQNNMKEVGNAILSYQAVKNEFLDALVGRVAFTQVSNRRFSNPLAVLKKGSKPYGTDIEDIYVNPVKGVSYDGITGTAGKDTSDMLEVTPPDVKTIFHRLNRQDKYPVSVSNAQLRTAFTSGHEMEKFIDSIMSAMYSGDEIAEFLLMRNLVTEAIADNKVKTMDFDYDGSEESCKDLVKLLKTLSLNFTLPSTEYNGYNVANAEGIAAKTTTPCTTWTPKENQVILIRSDIDASTDVEVLAKAFNMEKTDFIKRKFVVDSFGDTDTLCFITDEAAFDVTDVEYCVENFRNGSNLVTNFWLHHWQRLSLSLFANGVAIKQKAAA